MKTALYRYAPVLLAAVLLGFVLLAVAVFGFRDWPLLASVSGLVLGLVYFLQRQRLEETKLFKELFTEFNARYEALNQDLDPIVGLSESAAVTPQQRSVLIDYFNLCAEEYLFYSLGYIRKETWRAWMSGMGYYYRDPIIRELWNSELEQGSYYGLSKKQVSVMMGDV